MKILISNDDGVTAPGIRILAEMLQSMGQVRVFAPDRNRSGASNSLTLDNPLRAKSLENGFVSIEGTPTDCVHLALTGFLKQEPDIVVSGINAGANLGDDVFYSGTVAAAREGRFLGLPAIAISLANEESAACKHYETAALVAKALLTLLEKEPFNTDNVILNVNVPDIPFDELRGYEVTRLGTRSAADPVTKQLDPRGHVIYWVGSVGTEQDAGPGTDFYAVRHNKVSITPLRLEWTNKDALLDLEQWSQGLSLTIRDKKNEIF
jgi:5'-nucleotidase